jgi:hypothetical protein
MEVGKPIRKKVYGFIIQDNEDYLRSGNTLVKVKIVELCLNTNGLNKRKYIC